MSLSVQNISFSYGSNQVLQDISFEINKGEFWAVIGPNGVGKSTLFRCILGLLQPAKGSITIDGRDINTMSRKVLAQRIAYIPQIHRPVFGYSVRDTVLMGTTRYLSAFEQPKAAQVEKANSVLRILEMENIAEKNYATLSGGQQQMVLIARALAQDAEILVMDEPTSALDYGNQMKILALLRTLAQRGYSVVVSTHNPQHALDFSEKVLALAPDKSSVQGRAEEVIDKELMARLYNMEVEFVSAEGRKILVPQYREDGGYAHIPMGK